jgi:hypothetical protein
MRKILLSLLTISGASAFAVNNGAFQEFDDQYDVGFGVSNVTLSNGGGQQSLQQSQFITLDVERLFDVGIWMDVNANLVLSQNSLGSQATGTGMGNSGINGYPGMPASQDPNFGGVNAKVGYAFPIIPEHLQLTPYVLGGRNTNLAMSSIVSNGYANVTNDYYYTGGIGGRLEYRINKYILVYADQLASYNWDQSAPVGGIPPQNNMIWKSTLGAKFNLVKNLQVGLQGFYNNYQAEAAVPQSTPSNNGGGTYTIYQPQSSLGGLVTVGLTY